MLYTCMHVCTYARMHVCTVKLSLMLISMYVVVVSEWMDGHCDVLEKYEVHTANDVEVNDGPRLCVRSCPSTQALTVVASERIGDHPDTSSACALP